jgi:hypothetical protein
MSHCQILKQSDGTKLRRLKMRKSILTAVLAAGLTTVMVTEASAQNWGPYNGAPGYYNNGYNNGWTPWGGNNGWGGNNNWGPFNGFNSNNGNGNGNGKGSFNFGFNGNMEGQGDAKTENRAEGRGEGSGSAYGNNYMWNPAWGPYPGPQGPYVNPQPAPAAPAAPAGSAAMETPKAEGAASN